MIGCPRQSSVVGCLYSQSEKSGRLPSRIGRFFFTLQGDVKPGAGIDPPALGGGDGNAQSRGGFRGGEAGEEAELYQLGLLRLVGGKPRQGVVEVQQVRYQARRDIASPVGKWPQPGSPK